MVRVRPLLKRLYYHPAARRVASPLVDGVDVLRGRRRSDLPSRYLRGLSGRGDPIVIGAAYRRFLIDLAGLRPDSRMLDVGCGYGRMALPLLDYVTDGSYDGFDVISENVQWCETNITAKRANFRFAWCDVRNGLYNPQGRWSPADYTFPYDDESFDVALLSSVFTHIRPAGMRRYVSELARVLEPGGRCLSTFFLLNDEARHLLARRGGTVRFPHSLQDRDDELTYYASERGVPEFDTGYDEDAVRRLFGEHGLAVVEPIHYGEWCGRADHLSFQDIVVAVRE